MTKLLLLVLPLLVLVTYKYLSRLPAELRKRRIKHLALTAGAVLLIAVALRGGAYVTAAAGAIGLALLRALPSLIQRWITTKQQAPPAAGPAPPPPPPNAKMTRAEALSILGLEPGATREQIMERYKALMKNVHPDRGGSSRLAAEVNQAKDTLLG